MMLTLAGGLEEDGLGRCLTGKTGLHPGAFSS